MCLENNRSKNKAMKKSKIIVTTILILVGAFIVSAQEIIPFNSDYWEIVNEEVAPQDIKLTSLYGKECLHLPAKHTAYLKNNIPDDFKLEMDIAGVVMPGLGFRSTDKRNYEYIYLRIMSSNKGDALQYFPVYNGSFSWQLYNYPDFEKPATFPTRLLFSTIRDSEKTITGQRME